MDKLNKQYIFGVIIDFFIIIILKAIVISGGDPAINKGGQSRVRGMHDPVKDVQHLNLCLLLCIHCQTLTFFRGGGGGGGGGVRTSDPPFWIC